MPRETVLIAQIEKKERFYDKIDSTQLIAVGMGAAAAFVSNAITSVIISFFLKIPEATGVSTQAIATGSFIGILLKGICLIGWILFYEWKVFKYMFVYDKKYGKYRYQAEIIKYFFRKKQRVFLYSKKGLNLVDAELLIKEDME